jgi:hypothetical protein
VSPVPVAAKSSTTPESRAAAKAAAVTYFDLYAAGQYAAVYPMIAPTDRKLIRQTVWVAVHRACRPSTAAGLTYKVTHPILAGSIAVLTVGFSGAAAALGSEQITFSYASGSWYYQPSDMSVYRDHDVAQAIAAAKADDLCS